MYAGAAQWAHARLQATLKAVVVGRDASDPASREAREATTLFSSAGALEPPYDPAALCLLVEYSHAAGCCRNDEPRVAFDSPSAAIALLLARV